METLTINGAKYITNDALAFGDYGGAGSVGAANIRSLEKEYAEDLEYGSYSRAWDNHSIEGTPSLVILEDMCSSKIAYLREDIADETLAAVSDYPCLDDQEVSAVEMEWEQEAWSSWLQHDLIRTLPEDEDNDLRDKATDMNDEDLFQCYRNAMEECNEYPTPEYSGVHVDVERIAKAFANHVAAFNPAAALNGELF
jgi:hypothetical protein